VAMSTRDAAGGCPTVPFPVLINPRGGSAQGLAEGLRTQSRRAGIPVALEEVDPRKLPTRLRTLMRAGTRRLAVCGGDGTLGTAAGVLAGSGVELAVIPGGTRNHLAADLGVPPRPEDALGLLTQGTPRAVDVGEVNNRVFVNNAALGVYPRSVRRREAYSALLGWPKLPAAARAWVGLLGRMPRYRLTLHADDGEPRTLVTPLLFVGNNHYHGEPLVPARRRLDDGRLHLIHLTVQDPTRFAYLVLRSLFGDYRRLPEVATLETSTASVHSRQRRLRVTLDGEVVLMRPPVHFTTRPAALRVLL
jgi:diacylglycerol kinase family enzyme